MNWREEQQRFWQWVTRPQDLRDSTEDIDRLFAEHTALSQTDALGIYNNAYHQRLINISSELYPLLYRTLGDDAYTTLWLAYLQEHPPRPGSMNLLGTQLHDFASEHSHYGKLPALLDIIALETAFIDCFDRIDEDAFTLQQLQELPQDQWPSMRWQAKQDWVLINSAFDLESYYRKLQAHFANNEAEPGSAPFGVERLPQAADYLVRRQNQRMHFQKITPAMGLFLSAVQRGDNFAQICEALAEKWPELSTPELSLGLLLQAIEWQLLTSAPIQAA